MTGETTVVSNHHPDAPSVPVVPVDHGPSGQGRAGTVKLDQHLPVANPAKAVVPPARYSGRRVVSQLTAGEKEAGLATLKKQKVTNTTLKWAAPAAGLGAVGGTAAGIFGGAVLGAMVGGPVGAIVGGVLGGLFVFCSATGTGVAIGHGRGKQQAKQITHDTLLHRYDPDGEAFDGLMNRLDGDEQAIHNALSAGGLLADEDMGIELPKSEAERFTPQQKARIRSNLRNLLDARVKLELPLTKRFAEEAVLVAARMEAAGVGEVFQQHLEAMLSMRLAAHGGPDGALPLDDHWLGDLKAISNMLISPMSVATQQQLNFDPEDNPGVLEGMTQGMAKVVTAARHNSLVSPDFVARLRRELIDIAARQDLTADQKRAVMDTAGTQFAAALRSTTGPARRGGDRFRDYQRAVLQNPALLSQTLNGLARIHTEVQAHNERAAQASSDPKSADLHTLDAQRLSDEYMKYMGRVLTAKGGRSGYETSSDAFIDSLMSITQANLPGEHEDVAINLYTTALCRDVDSHFAVRNTRAAALAGLAVESERVLVSLKQGSAVVGQGDKQRSIKIRPEDHALFADRYRRSVANHIFVAPESRWKNRQIHDLAALMSHHLYMAQGSNISRGESAEQKSSVYAKERDLDYQADKAVDDFWNRALDKRATVAQTAGMLRRAIQASYRHESVRQSGGQIFAGDGGSHYAEGSGMSFDERFAARLQLSLKERFADRPEEAAAAYDKLMGEKGALRALMMIGHLQALDERGGGPENITRDAAKDFYETGIAQSIRQLGAAAGKEPELVEAEIESLAAAANEAVDAVPRTFTWQLDFSRLGNNNEGVQKALTEKAGLDPDTLTEACNQMNCDLPKLIAAKAGSEAAHEDLARRLGLDGDPIAGGLDDDDFEPEEVDAEALAPASLTDMETAQAFDALTRAGATEREAMQWILNGLVDATLVKQLNAAANDGNFERGQDASIVESLRQTMGQFDREEAKALARLTMRQFFTQIDGSNLGVVGEMEIKPALNDGDCFYHALESQTGKPMQEIRNALHGRADAIVTGNQGAARVQDIDVYRVAGAPIPQLLLQEDVSNGVIAKPAAIGGRESWASEFHAALAAEEFQRPVVVFSFNRATSQVDTRFYGAEAYGGQPPIMLSYDGVNHFDGVGPKNSTWV
ncbi:MAG: hypothetical protein AAGI11_12805 [Pseudomonadota bacterium]